jgi:hypothetical protein
MLVGESHHEVFGFQTPIGIGRMSGPAALRNPATILCDPPLPPEEIARLRREGLAVLAELAAPFGVTVTSKQVRTARETSTRPKEHDHGS